MRGFKSAKWLVVLLVFLPLANYGGVFSRLGSRAKNEQTFRVAKIIDGDTIKIVDRKGREMSLRYEGIDCPEIPTTDSPGDPFSEEATDMNAGLLKSGTVKVRFARERYGRYGRLIGFVFSDGENVNKRLVEAGLATVFEIGFQDPALMEKLRHAQKSAMANRRGIWSGQWKFKPGKGNEKFMTPAGKIPEMEGRRIVAQGRVTDSLRKKSGIIILKTTGGFDMVIFGNSVGTFLHFGINPLEQYTGKTVSVVGRVSMYRGRPNIRIGHPASIRLVK